MTTTAPPGSDLSHASPSRAPPSRSYSTRRDPSHQPSRPSTATSATANSASASASAAAARSSSHHRRASSSHRSANQVPPPQHDYGTTRIASHSKRSPSRDLPRGPDPNRPHRRSSSRSSHPRSHHPPDMPSAAAAGAAPPSSSHGRSSHAGTDAQPSSHGTKQSRSRTTIPTQSGKWILGKTIGAGSMGKVKLARKEDGSEQVRLLTPIHPLHPKAARVHYHQPPTHDN